MVQSYFSITTRAVAGLAALLTLGLVQSVAAVENAEPSWGPSAAP